MEICPRSSADSERLPSKQRVARSNRAGGTLNADVMEQAYIPALEAGFCGFDSRRQHPANSNLPQVAAAANPAGVPGSEKVKTRWVRRGGFSGNSIGLISRHTVGSSPTPGTAE